MQIASNGQSLQLLFFCVSGQHGMSPDIDAMSDIATLDDPIAATGEVNGAAISPAITKIASRRPIRRQKVITYIAMASEIGKAGCPSHLRNRLVGPTYLLAAGRGVRAGGKPDLGRHANSCSARRLSRASLRGATLPHCFKHLQLLLE
mgnify:FL=1